MKRIAKGVVFVVVILFVTNFTYAQSDIGFKGIGGKLGFVSPEDPIESTIGFGAVADLGTITPDIHLGALLDYWSKSYDLGGFNGSSEASFSEFIIGAVAKYYFPMENSQLKPYAGGGLGFTIGKAKVESNGFSQSDSNTDLGFRVLAGAEYMLSPTINGFAEFVYHTDGADFWGIFAGIIYPLGK